MRRPAICVVWAVLAALGATAPVQARVVATSVTGFVAGPALAADGRLVLGERHGSGDIAAVVIDPAGARAPQTLAVFGAAPRGSFTAMTLAGTGGVVGVQRDARVFSEPRIGGSELRSSEGRTLLPSAILGSCPHAFPFSPGFAVAGGVGFAATLGEDCGALGGPIRVHGPGGVVTLPTAPGGQTSLLRAAGHYLAWAEVTPGPPTAFSVVLADALTGTVLVRSPTAGHLGPDDLAVGADGTLAWIAQARFPGCSGVLFAASAAHPAARELSGPQTPCPFGAGSSSGRGAMAVAGGRIVYPSSPAFAVTDGSGTGSLVADLPALNGAAGPIAFDGRTLYGVRNDCDADRLLAVDVTAGGAAPTAISSPDGPGCPAARTGSARLRLDRTHAVRVRLACPAGCRGTLRLVQQRGSRERVAGQREVGGRGAISVRVQLAPYAAGLAACAGGLRLRATLYRDALPMPTRNPRTALALGVLRVRSSERCRHGAGPGFERRVPMP